MVLSASSMVELHCSPISSMAKRVQAAVASLEVFSLCLSITKGEIHWFAGPWRRRDFELRWSEEEEEWATIDYYKSPHFCLSSFLSLPHCSFKHRFQATLTDFESRPQLAECCFDLQSMQIHNSFSNIFEVKENCLIFCAGSKLHRATVVTQINQDGRKLLFSTAAAAALGMEPWSNG